MAKRLALFQRSAGTGEEFIIIFVDNCDDGRPGARNINAERAQILCKFEHFVSAVDQRQAVTLVQRVLGGEAEQRGVTVAEGRGGDRL